MKRIILLAIATLNITGCASMIQAYNEALYDTTGLTGRDKELVSKGTIGTGMSPKAFQRVYPFASVRSASRHSKVICSRTASRYRPYICATFRDGKLVSWSE